MASQIRGTSYAFYALAALLLPVATLGQSTLGSSPTDVQECDVSFLSLRLSYCILRNCVFGIVCEDVEWSSLLREARIAYYW